MKHFLIVLALFTAAAFAADIDGTWKATAEGPNGSMERTFVFKADGSKLTGETTSSLFGKSTIADGKIEGDSLSFILRIKYQDNEMKVHYKGKINGKEIKLTAEIPDAGRTIEWLARKVE